MDKLVNREHTFYTDQKTVRECTLSNQIDTEYEEEQRIICEHGEEQLKKSEEEEAFIIADIETMNNYDEDVNISMNTSISDTLNVSNNNCISERDLSQFDKEAVVAHCRNRCFKAKNIRNNMVLYKSKQAGKVNRISRKMSLILAERETKWNATQDMKMKERLELKLKKSQKAKDYTRKLLEDCKSWGGPITSTDELRYILKGKDNHHQILKTEMAYYAHMHKADKIAR